MLQIMFISDIFYEEKKKLLRSSNLLEEKSKPLD